MDTRPFKQLQILYKGKPRVRKCIYGSSYVNKDTLSDNFTFT